MNVRVSLVHNWELTKMLPQNITVLKKIIAMAWHLWRGVSLTPHDVSSAAILSESSPQYLTSSANIRKLFATNGESKPQKPCSSTNGKAD